MFQPAWTGAPAQAPRAEAWPIRLHAHLSGRTLRMAPAKDAPCDWGLHVILGRAAEHPSETVPPLNTFEQSGALTSGLIGAEYQLHAVPLYGTMRIRSIR